MNGERWTTVEPSFTDLLCGKRGYNKLGHINLIYLCDSDGKEEQYK